jgi:hypothetical protein
MSDTKELVVIIRPSFMKFCHDGCKAAAFNHVLYWIAQKAKGQPAEEIQAGNVTWYATTEEITAGLANAWSVEKVRKEVNALITLGIIGRGRNQQWGADRTKHFFFGKEQCATFMEVCQKHDIRIQQIGLCADVLSLLNLAGAKLESMECKSQKREMQNANSRNAQARPKREFAGAITKDSSKVSCKEESSVAPSSISFSPEEQWLDTLLAPLVQDASEPTEKKKGQYTKLLLYVKTEQDVTSLCASTRLPDGKLWIQNLVKRVEAWNKRRQATSQQSSIEAKIGYAIPEAGEELPYIGESNQQQAGEMDALAALTKQVCERYGQRLIRRGADVKQLYYDAVRWKVPFTDFEQSVRQALETSADIDACIWSVHQSLSRQKSVA